MARSVHHILLTVLKAGAQDVDERDLRWAEYHYPAINQAMAMGFLKRISSVHGSKFSLTRSGYIELGREPPPLTMVGIAKMLAIFFLFVR